MDYQTLKINSHYRIEIVDSHEELQLSDAVKTQIDKIWQVETAKRHLFNGSFLSALSFDNRQLKGIFVPYKYFIAQLKNPDLKPLLKITPVSVSGLTWIGDNVVFAKRSSFVTQFQNHYELAPSGGIDLECVEGNRVDLRGQIKKELEEELGVSPRKVKAIKFFALIYDKELESIDLCADIRINPFAMHSQALEYSQIITVPSGELDSFIKMENEQFVPLSLLILHLSKCIRPLA